MTSAVYYLMGFLNYLVGKKLIYLGMLQQFIARELFK